jgi:hypothetical protein
MDFDDVLEYEPFIAAYFTIKLTLCARNCKKEVRETAIGVRLHNQGFSASLCSSAGLQSRQGAERR